MAVYQVTFHQRLDDYAVVQTLTEPDIAVGQSITLAGLGHGLNGAHTVYDLPSYLFIGVDTEGDLLFDYLQPIQNQVLFYNADDDLERSCRHSTWHPDVHADLHMDYRHPNRYMVRHWVSGRRNSIFSAVCNSGQQFHISQTSGVGLHRFFDHGSQWRCRISHDHDGWLSIYRQRGAIDQFASFSDMGTASVTGLSPLIKQLAGIPRPAVA
jgi:hypothetical protein